MKLSEAPVGTLFELADLPYIPTKYVKLRTDWVDVQKALTPNWCFVMPLEQFKICQMDGDQRITIITE